MLSLWYLSFLISIVAFFVGIVKKSWHALLLSTLTFLPIAYYFIGANNAWRYVGFTPIILLALTLLFWQINRKRHSR
ncbi:hypothetical protein [Solibacillus cecembensis]|uniref:hypothetical protein n=1 Tax=Solibacillus cecembensis TaxID=459347 RepID=UPI003CFDD73D